MRHALCTFNLITLEHRQAVDSMRRFAREVVPLLEEQEALTPQPVSVAPQSMVRAIGDVQRAPEPRVALRVV